MHNQDLGRVAVVARGAYDPSAEYERLDAVSYNGSSYLVRKHCRGVEPAEGEYYMLMAQAGDSTAANVAAEQAIAAAERADSASGRADTAAGSAEQQAAAAGAAADSANTAAAAAQEVVDFVEQDINQLKDGLVDLLSFTGTRKDIDFTGRLGVNTKTGITLKIGNKYLIRTESAHAGTINAFISGATSVYISLTDSDKEFIPTATGELILYNYGSSAGLVTLVITAGVSEAINGLKNDTKHLESCINSINDRVSKKIDAEIPSGRWKEYTYPDGFLGTYKPVRILTDGHFWRTDYNRKNFRKTSESAKTYYVSPEGKWNNAGTRQSPYSLYQAMKKAVDGDTIIMLDGEYRIDNHESFGEITAIGKSINIIGDGNPKWIVGVRKSFTMDESTGLCKLTYPNSQRALDDNGVLYDTVSSLSACQSTPNTTYTNGTDIYANVPIERLQNILVLVYTSGIEIMPSDRSVSVYIENVSFYGGMWNIRTGSTSEYSCELICDSCEFAYQVDNARSGVMVRSAKALFVNCNAHHAMQDGFQYTKMTGGNDSCGFAEIGCNGFSNGHIESDNTCNGSTSHSGICGIRINGNYYDNHGGNVVDVQNNTQSINCGCNALNSCASDDGYRQGFGLQQEGAKMWLYDCISVGNFYDFYGVPNTEIIADRCYHARSNYSYDYSGNLTDSNSETLEYINLLRNLLLVQKA